MAVKRQETTYTSFHNFEVQPTPAISGLPAPLTVPIPEACRMIGCGRTKMHEMMNTGDVRAVRIAGRTLIDVASLHALVAAAPSWKGAA